MASLFNIVHLVHRSRRLLVYINSKLQNVPGVDRHGNHHDSLLLFVVDIGLSASEKNGLSSRELAERLVHSTVHY